MTNHYYLSANSCDFLLGSLQSRCGSFGAIKKNAASNETSKIRMGKLDGSGVGHVAVLVVSEKELTPEQRNMVIGKLN